ncbi:MAG: hypothetical protein SWX82_28930 [Cyanobacteriota bacterium]|nr:hypothetical protein [Cyanobacteriota bacterium]
MKIFVIFHPRSYGWKDLIEEKQAFMGASQDENISGIAPGKNSSILKSLLTNN